MSRLLDDEEISRQLIDLPGWRRHGDALRAVVVAPDFRTAIRLVDEVAEVAEEMDHHPDMDIRYRSVGFTLSTHSAGGVTQLDVELAHRVSQAARALGAEVEEAAGGE